MTAGCLRSQNEPPVEHGVKVRERPFSAAEIKKIFGGQELSPQMGNRALAVIQGRRIAGTLDLEFPADIASSLNLQQFEAALEWLRKNRPIDEDAAIIGRIEREEREEEARLIRRGQELGLYKPQSGSYEAELGEGGDVSGKSVLKEMRKHNEARRKEKEERERREWLEGEAKDQEKIKRHVEKHTALQHLHDNAITEGKLVLQTTGYVVEQPAYSLQLGLVPIPHSALFWHGCRSTICGLRTWIRIRQV